MSQYFRWNNKKKGNKKKSNKNQIAQCSVPSFRIDLQCNPLQRWTHIVKSYHKEIKRLIEAILSLEQYQMSSDDEQNNKNNDKNNNENGDSNKKNFFTNLTLGVFERLKKLGGKEYIQEMQGIAKLFKKDGISIEHVLLTHLLYESFCGCTSIISKNKVNNSLILGRTLDWIDFDEQLLRNLTIDIEVYRGSNYLYRYTTFAGYIGSLTALKFNQFGFAINFREFSTNEANDNVHDIDSWPIGLLGRFICEHCNDYKSAIKMWKNSPLMAPTYIIICGNNQSMLITRDEGCSIKPINVSLLTDDKKEVDNNNNNNNNNNGNDDEEKKNDSTEMDYILQTNIDHWSYEFDAKSNNEKSKKKKGKKKKKNSTTKIDHDTMDSIRRLNTGHKVLTECKGNLNQDEMWNLLYQYPIHDRNWTIYTTVMHVATGYYKTIRHIYK